MAASSDVDDLTEQQHVVNDSPFDRQNSDVRFINISIKCYEKKTGSGFKEEYYAYKIISIVAPHNDYEEDDEHASGNRSRYEVWRRYSEFEYLRNFMLTVYPHVVIPPIPEKALRGSVSLLNKMAITNEDTDFLLQRQHALEIFLVRISRHPTLCKNVWFHKFCEEAVWKEQLLQSGFIPKTNSMFQSLSLQLSKRVPDSRFQEVKQYANDVESIFKAILEIREKMNTSLMSIYKVHSNYGRVFRYSTVWSNYMLIIYRYYSKENEI
jgi:sorting nexin-4